MKFLIWFVMLIAVSQARPWQDDESHNCSIAADAKAMENIFRAERLIINLVDPYKLKDFLMNVTETILEEIQGGRQFIRFLHLTHTDEQIKMHVHTKQGYLEGLFNGVDSLSQINASNINYFLGDAHWEFARLLRDLEYSNSYNIRWRLNRMLQRLISRCQNIIRNGCKEEPSRPDEGTTEAPWRPDEGTTEAPWRPDEGTTEAPWRPDEGTTESPWRPDEGTTEAPWRPDEGTTEDPWRPEYGTTEDYWYH